MGYDLPASLPVYKPMLYRYDMVEDNCAQCKGEVIQRMGILAGNQHIYRLGCRKSCDMYGGLKARKFKCFPQLFQCLIREFACAIFLLVNRDKYVCLTSHD